MGPLLLCSHTGKEEVMNKSETVKLVNDNVKDILVRQ